MTLLRMSLFGAILIILILALRPVVVRFFPKRTLVVMWWVALFRLLVPFDIPWRYSAYSAIREIPTRGDLLRDLDLNRVFTSAAPTGIPLSDPTVATAGQAAARDLNAAAIAPAAPVSSEWILPAIYIAGLLLTLGFFVFSYIRLMERLRGTRAVTDESVLAPLADFAIRRPVRVLSCDSIASPFTFGLIRPVLVIPQGLLSLDAGDVRAVVYHELIHIKRFDAPLKTLVALCCCVHWFNPLCWIMAKTYARDTELACDAAVMRKLGYDGRKSYASTLLNLQCSDRGLLTGGFSRLAIKERVVWIMKYRRFSLAATCLAATLVILMAAAFATSPVEIARAVETVATAWPFHAYFDPIGADQDFHLSNVDVSDDGKILLSGYIDTGTIKMGNLITCDIEAYSDWDRLEVSRDALELDTYTLSDSFYTDAKFVDGDTIAVLRSIPKRYTEYSAMLIKGGVEYDVDIMAADCLSKNEYGIYPVPGGLLINGKPDTTTVRVTRMDMRGEILWQMLLAEPIRFNGILTANGAHLAFGYKGALDAPEPVIIAFDDSGEILWRYDGATKGEFTDALITGDGNIVLVGCEPNVFEGRGQGIIMSFDPSGRQLFANEYIYNDGERYIDAKFSSVAKSSTGYMACINNPDDYAIRLAAFDLYGNVIGESDIHTTGLALYDRTDVRAEKLELFSAAGEVFLIIHGAADYENEWGNTAYVTVLTQILPNMIEVNPKGEVDL